jgi:hypothetical protein
LQGFHPTTILQNVEKYLNIPAAAVPVDDFHGLPQRFN